MSVSPWIKIGEMMMIRKISISGGDEPLLLPLTSFVVLEPVKDVFALNLAVLPEASRDPLYLLCTWGPDPIVVVKLFEYPYLFTRWCPPRTTLPT